MEETMKSKSLCSLLLGIALSFVVAGLAGCSTDENPISPQKMQEIRQKEQNERKNFNPNMTPPAQGSNPSAGR